MNGFLPDAFSLPGFDLDAFVAATLAEDLGPDGRDVTSEAVIPADAMFDGVMDSRDAVTLAGLPIAAAFFRALDPQVDIEMLHRNRAPLCRECLDWSERKSHLAGSLGRALLTHIEAVGWARRDAATRVVTFSAKGEKQFEAQLLR